MTHRGMVPVAAAARLPTMAARRFRPAARVALFLASRGRCAACGAALTPGWHADHVTPFQAGGATAPANGRALCPRCNLAKGGRLP
jgi:5-methylcytosine-specific restriction endonuclease McrA